MGTKSRTASMSSTNYYFMLALVTALVVLVTIYFGQILIKTSFHNNRILTAVNLANSQLNNNLTAATSLVSNYAGIAATQILVNDALPKNGDYPGLTALLENAGNTTGVEIKTVTADQLGTGTLATGAMQGAQPFSFTVDTAGTYSQVTAFLSTMQLSVRPLIITSIELSGTGKSMLANVTGMAYYQADTQLPFTSETIK
jgi:hypothetical protein